jgi:hypothetical protein
MLAELSESFGIKGVINSWGLTEFPVATSAAQDDPADVLATTVGRPARAPPTSRSSACRQLRQRFAR